MTYTIKSETKKDWTFVAFFTEEYEEEFLNLLSSIMNFDVNFYGIKVESKKSWDENTHYKPTVILDAMNETNMNIVYIDADATLERQPTLFDNIKTDIAYHVLRHRLEVSELLSGTLYFKNNDKVKVFLQSWIKDCQGNYDITDQKKLEVLVEKEGKLATQELPVEYCAIFDHKSARNKDIVIKHHQASRRLRKVANARRV